MQYEDSATKDYKKLADQCVPDLTNVVNLEMETHRKYTADFVFPKIRYPEELPMYERRLYKILKMIPSMRDYVVTETIRFVNFKGENAKLRRERRPTADWWQRLSSAGNEDEIHYSLTKDYQRWADERRSKARMITSLANYAAFHGDEYGTLAEDWQDNMARLNDNDLKLYERKRAKKRTELEQKFEKQRQIDSLMIMNQFWEGLSCGDE